MDADVDSEILGAPIIKTIGKSKLPKGLSYPLGAQAITKALVEAGVRQTDTISLSFTNRAGWPASKFNKLMRERMPYSIIWGLASRCSGTINLAGQMRFVVIVRPVLSDLRTIASRLLTERGLPLLAEWVQRHRQRGWNTRDHEMCLAFEPTSETLTASYVDRV